MAKATFPVQSSSVSRAKRTALIGQGQRMSNWLYNLAQSDQVPKWVRDEAKTLCDSWDSIKSGGQR